MQDIPTDICTCDKINQSCRRFAKNVHHPSLLLVHPTPSVLHTCVNGSWKERYCQCSVQAISYSDIHISEAGMIILQHNVQVTGKLNYYTEINLLEGKIDYHNFIQSLKPVICYRNRSRRLVRHLHSPYSHYAEKYI